MPITTIINNNINIAITSRSKITVNIVIVVTHYLLTINNNNNNKYPKCVTN
jgi:hypothetical protein